MARAKGWIWISLALVCALSAGGLTYVFLQRQNEATQVAIDNAARQAEQTKEATVSLPVAVRDLERGTMLTTDLFTTKEFPVSLAPTSALTETEQLDGQVLAEFVGQGDIFRNTSIYGGAGGPLSSEIEPGRTVITFPIVDLFTSQGLFVEGDRIDMLLTMPAKEGQEGGAMTGYSIQNVRIMRILGPPPTEENPHPAPTALLLELDPADALLVKKIKDGSSVIDMALRSPVDDKNFDVDVVTDDDVLRLVLDGTPPQTVGNAP